MWNRVDILTVPFHFAPVVLWFVGVRAAERESVSAVLHFLLTDCAMHSITELFRFEFMLMVPKSRTPFLEKTAVSPGGLFFLF